MNSNPEAPTLFGHLSDLESCDSAVMESHAFKKDYVVQKTSFRDVTYEQQLPRLDSDNSPFASWWRAFMGAGATVANHATELTAVDVFSGAGGFSVGLSSAAASFGASVKFAAAIDVDFPALQVHANNHRTHEVLPLSADLCVDWQIRGKGDEARFKYEPEVVHDALTPWVGSVDVLIGGPPCQGHSSLNNASRHSDVRNSLYLTMPALGVALKAPIVVIENVPGVVRDKSGVVQAAEKLFLESGYFVTKGTLAAHQLGWPQTRKRFFMVAVRGVQPVSIDSQAAASHQEGLSLRWALQNLVEDAHPILDGKPAYSAENVERMQFLVDNQSDQDLPLSRRPKSHQQGTSYKSVYGRMNWDEPAPTITTGFSTPGRGRFTHPDEGRTLTVREAARVQGFPDSYFSREVLNDLQPNRSQLAKWVGDAVPPRLGHVALLTALGPYLVSE